MQRDGEENASLDTPEGLVQNGCREEAQLVLVYLTGFKVAKRYYRTWGAAITMRRECKWRVCERHSLLLSDTVPLRTRARRQGLQNTMSVYVALSTEGCHTSQRSPRKQNWEKERERESTFEERDKETGTDLPRNAVIMVIVVIIRWLAIMDPGKSLACWEWASWIPRRVVLDWREGEGSSTSAQALIQKESLWRGLKQES